MHDHHDHEYLSSSYYELWLKGLLALLQSKGVADEKLAGQAELEARRDAWDRATRATPHGQPILLENDPLGRHDAGR